MLPPNVFDVHAHVMPLGVPVLSDIAASDSAMLPHAVDDGGGAGRIVAGRSDFRSVRSSLWSVQDRLAELDRSGVSHQAISPVPVSLLDHSDDALATAYARWFNIHLVQMIEQGGGRLTGIGMVPLPHIDASLAELEWLHSVGVLAVEIGTRVAERELDDDVLRPFWRKAAELGMGVFIHPRDGGRGAIRRTGFLWDFGVGMLTDTALAAGALVFGGVLDELPTTRVLMAHGCGTFGRAYPRLRLAARMTPPVLTDPDVLLRSIWVDSLTFDRDELLAVINRFGGDRVMLGSDYPFIQGQPEESLQNIMSLAVGGAIDEREVLRIRNDNAVEFFGRRPIDTQLRQAASLMKGIHND